MRARIASLARRLDKVEAAAIDDSGPLRGGVMRVPPILPMNEWQAIAMPTLRALAEAAAEDIDRHAPAQQSVRQQVAAQPDPDAAPTAAILRHRKKLINVR